MLLLAAVFVAALAASIPHHPQWPPNFSTTAIIHETGRRRPEFARWFYSTAQNTDRLGTAPVFFFPLVRFFADTSLQTA